LTDDAYRIKNYYAPRIVLSVADFLAPLLPECTLVLLDAQELLILKNLVQYAERRVTWAQEYRDTTYLTPDVETWDAIQAKVAELEGKLMTNCEELADLLERIADALDSHTSEFQTMATAQGLVAPAIEAQTTATVTELQSTVTELQQIAANVSDAADVVAGSLDTGMGSIASAIACVCNALQQRVSASVVNPTVGGDTDVTNFWGYGSGIPDTSPGAQPDEDACELAQCWFQALYEVVTEWILPVSRFAFDNLVPAGAALIAAITGGAALPVVLGVWTFAELVQELLELGYDAAETNLVNWLWSVRQDFICDFYAALKDGGSMAATWESVYLDLVSGSGSISPGDKAIVHIAGLTGAYLAWRAKQADSSWWQTTPEVGYCAVCPQPPIQGSDWFGVAIPEETGTITVTHPGGGGSWQAQCWSVPMLAGYTCVGAQIQRISFTGEGNVKFVSKGSCPGDWSLNIDSTGWNMEDYAAMYYHNPHLHNEWEARDTLNPGAQMVADWNAGQGTLGGARCNMWSVYGLSLTFRVTYLVYQGTYTP
jgi:hypothetical protein